MNLSFSSFSSNFKAKKQCSVVHCLIFLTILIEIASFICACILCALSAKNPFETHTIGNLTLYFNDVSENEEFEDDSETINIISEINNKNISNEIIDFRKNINLRKLVSNAFCDQIREDFKKYQGKQLSNIFDLNYGKIRGISISVVIITSVLIFCFIIFVIFQKFLYRHKWLSFFFACFTILLYPAKFALSILLLYYIEKGDIEAYDNFLDCKNVKKYIFDDFSQIKKLRNCFIAFLILNIIVQTIDKLEKCCEMSEKAAEQQN